MSKASRSTKTARSIGTGPGQQDGIEILPDNRLLVTSWDGRPIKVEGNPEWAESIPADARQAAPDTVQVTPTVPVDGGASATLDHGLIDRTSTRLEDTLAAHPQINRVGASSTVPLEDTPTLASQVRIEGHSSIDNTQDIAVFANNVSRDYFSVLGIPLIGGRVFSDADDTDSPRVYIVNQAMVERYFPVKVY